MVEWLPILTTFLLPDMENRVRINFFYFEKR